jgi:hypothetical protein
MRHPREAEIRELAHASPFAPFTITTSSGERYKVRTADHISLKPEPSHKRDKRSPYFMIWSDGTSSRWVFFDAITGVEISPMAAK